MQPLIKQKRKYLLKYLREPNFDNFEWLLACGFTYNEVAEYIGEIDFDVDIIDGVHTNKTSPIYNPRTNKWMVPYVYFERIMGDHVMLIELFSDRLIVSMYIAKWTRLDVRHVVYREYVGRGFDNGGEGILARAMGVKSSRGVGN